MKVNGQGQAKTLSLQEQAQVIEAMISDREGIRNIAMFVLGLNTGLRINELRTLNISDVIDSNGNIATLLTLQGQNTKSGKPRTVPINRRAAQALKDYLATRPEAKPSEPLFKSSGRGRISRSMCIRMFENTFANAGIKGASSHSMRRTFITTLHRNGTKIKVIARLAGHSSISVTDRYIDISEDEITEAVMGL